MNRRNLLAITLAWAAATALTLAVVALVPQGLGGGAMLAALGAVVVAALVSGADRRFWYISEQA